MKMVMIVIDEQQKEELEVFLERLGVSGYTEIQRVSGMGLSGPRLGSGAFPRTSAVVFTFLSAEALVRLKAGIDEFCAHCGERLKIVAWDVEQVA